MSSREGSFKEGTPRTPNKGNQPKLSKKTDAVHALILQPLDGF